MTHVHIRCVHVHNDKHSVRPSSIYNIHDRKVKWKRFSRGVNVGCSGREGNSRCSRMDKQKIRRTTKIKTPK